MTDKAKELAEEAKALAVQLEDQVSESAAEAAVKAKELARDLGGGARGALDRAENALKAPEGADLAPLLAATDLPELPGAGALGSLGVRLDREADLYRNVALRELGRVAWIDRLTLIVILLAFVGEAAIAAAVVFTAIVGALEGRGAMFALAAIILGAAPAGVAAVVASSRRVHRELAEDALARSRSIEDRLFELGLVMEWRTTDVALFQDALARLEGRMRSVPRTEDDA